jgi:hypothetical protein
MVLASWSKPFPIILSTVVLIALPGLMVVEYN